MASISNDSFLKLFNDDSENITEDFDGFVDSFNQISFKKLPIVLLKKIDEPKNVIQKKRGRKPGKRGRKKGKFFNIFCLAKDFDKIQVYNVDLFFLKTYVLIIAFLGKYNPGYHTLNQSYTFY